MRKAVLDNGVIVGGTIKSGETISLANLASAFPQMFGPKAKITETESYKLVSWVFRCINIRSDTLSGLPRMFYKGKKEIGEQPPKPWEDMDFDRLLWLTEAARMMWGASYWEKGQELLWLNPQSMTVEVKDGKIDYFSQSLTGQRNKPTFRPDEIVYIPMWDPKDDLRPGVSPTQVALTGAGLSRHLLRWAEAFFEKGAIPSLLLTTDRVISDKDPELERIKTFWQKVHSGVSNFWSTAVLGKGLKPTVIGQPVKDLVIPELSKETREDIAACFGVPITMLQQAAANYATAREDRQSYYKETVFPEAKQIAAAINQQWLRPLGYSMAFIEGKVEAIQQDEAEKADAVQMLMGKAQEQYKNGLLTRDRAVYLVEQLWDQMNIPIPENLPDKEPEVTPKQEAANAVAQNMQQAQQNQGGDQQKEPEKKPKPQPADNKALRDELRKWSRKAVKRGGDCDFESEIIPDWLTKAIHIRLLAGEERPFDALIETKQAGAIEQRMQGQLEAIFDRYHEQFTVQLLQGDEPHTQEMNDEIEAMLFLLFMTAITEGVLANAAMEGIEVNYEELRLDAEQWAKARAEEVITLIDQTTQERFAQVQADLDSGQTDRNSVAALVAAILGTSRAEGIAAFETSMAFSWAAFYLINYAASHGITTEEIWITADDERVCEICAPLHGTTRDVWEQTQPGGPPVHGRCRCRIWVVRLKKSRI